MNQSEIYWLIEWIKSINKSIYFIEAGVIKIKVLYSYIVYLYIMSTRKFSVFYMPVCCIYLSPNVLAFIRSMYNVQCPTWQHHTANVRGHSHATLNYKKSIINIRRDKKFHGPTNIFFHTELLKLLFIQFHKHFNFKIL